MEAGRVPTAVMRDGRLGIQGLSIGGLRPTGKRERGEIFTVDLKEVKERKCQIEVVGVADMVTLVTMARSVVVGCGVQGTIG